MSTVITNTASFLDLPGEIQAIILNKVSWETYLKIKSVLDPLDVCDKLEFAYTSRCMKEYELLYFKIGKLSKKYDKLLYN